VSLGIIFKGPEGIVLAADSRVTLTAKRPGVNEIIPATFDNATKLLKASKQDYVGFVTYGMGAIGEKMPRTAHSYLPEFEAELNKENKAKRLSVLKFAEKVSEFYLYRWEENMPKDYKGPDMVFLIGGFDAGAPYGRVFEVGIPSKPKPEEWQKESFGAVWGGQREFTDRLIQGFDPNLPSIVNKELGLNAQQQQKLVNELKKLQVPIPFPFLPLQDCVDLSIFLIRTTINIQRWQVGIRGVGGAIDVATITRTEGFKPVQQKKIRGEFSSWEED
jgi:hypothetical protein